MRKTRKLLFRAPLPREGERLGEGATLRRRRGGVAELDTDGEGGDREQKRQRAVLHEGVAVRVGQQATQADEEEGRHQGNAAATCSRRLRSFPPTLVILTIPAMAIR